LITDRALRTRQLGTVRILLRIEQRGNAAVLWAFAAKDTIGRVRERVAANLDVAPEAISLPLLGKALQDKFLVGRVWATGGSVTEVLLLTAKPRSVRLSGKVTCVIGRSRILRRKLIGSFQRVNTFLSFHSMLTTNEITHDL
jgi:hypothetical protein